MNLRLLAAAAVLVSAAVHLIMWFDGVRHQHVIGPAFMLNAIGGLVIAVLLVTWQHWVTGFLALGFGLSTLGAFTISTTVGLFGIHAHWSGGYVWTAATAEVIAIVTGALLLSRDNPLLDRSAGESQHGRPLSRPHLH
jgi:hypothetical protein